MFTVYARLSDGTPRTLEATPDLAALWSDKEAALWIDLEQPTEEEIRAVDAVIDLDSESLDDCLHGEQRPRVDEYENYIFLVVYGLLTSVRDKDGFGRIGEKRYSPGGLGNSWKRGEYLWIGTSFSAMWMTFVKTICRDGVPVWCLSGCENVIGNRGSR